MRDTNRGRRVWVAGLLLLLAIVGGCASSNGGDPTRSDPNRIGIEELALARAQGIADLEELIRRLRPQWLGPERIQSFHLESGIFVYDNGALLGGPEVLSTLALEHVREVRWLRSAEAGTLPGAGGRHVEGAIVIIRN